MSASVEDLIARARREELGRDGLRELEAALGASLEARLLYRAGREFDAEDSVLPRDEALAARITSRLLEARSKRRRPAFTRKLAVAGCLTAAVAAAATGPLPGALGLWGRSISRTVAADAGRSHSRVARGLPHPNDAANSTDATAGAPAAPHSGPATMQPEVSTRGTLSVPGEGRSSASRTERTRPPTPHDAEGVSAAGLFAEASRARSDGRSAHAIELYAELESRFPSSAEAHAGNLGAGMLELGHGRPAEALRHFRRFLADSPAAELAPEALWGQAQALERLGRSEEARGVWSTLLARHPESVYANAARSRLEPKAR